MKQYSLWSLLALTMLVAVSAALLRPGLHSTVRIETILNRNISNAEKLRALSQYVSIGDYSDDVSNRLNTLPDIDGEGVGFYDCYYYECGLRVSCYPDGTTYAIGYDSRTDAAPGFHWLHHPGVATWP